MIPIKRKLLYIFRDTLLRLRVRWSGETITFSLGYHVDRVDAKGKPKWDGERCMRNTTHGKEKVPAYVINAAIEELERKINLAFEVYENKNIIPTKEQLKSEVSGIKTKKEKDDTFFRAYDEFLEEGRTIFQWSEGTLKKMRTLKKLLLKYDPTMTFERFDKEELQGLMAYQTQNSVSGESRKEIEKGKAIIHYKGKYLNETINKNIQNVKWFIRWACDKGYSSHSEIADFTLRYKTVKRPVIFLTWDELMRVYNLDLSHRPELAVTRDMFCFCSFTSLRFSDMKNLCWANIKNDCINVVTKKTSDNLSIELNTYSRTILEKYKKDEQSLKDKVFPIKSSQKVNLRLKEICKICNVDSPVVFTRIYGSSREEIVVPKYEVISTHCGRRTFICNALALGIPPNVVMKWTGHSDYKAMLPYIEIADNVKAENMKKFDLLSAKQDYETSK